jgi:ABC-type nitrate/sulfonate/bicarbonate transport system ATPase subunit
LCKTEIVFPAVAILGPSQCGKSTLGFWSAIETTKPDKTHVVSPVSASYPFKNDVEVCGLSDLLKKVV